MVYILYENITTKRKTKITLNHSKCCRHIYAEHCIRVLCLGRCGHRSTEHPAGPLGACLQGRHLLHALRGGQRGGYLKEKLLRILSYIFRIRILLIEGVRKHLLFTFKSPLIIKQKTLTFSTQ